MLHKKYAPKNSGEVVGNEFSVRKIRNFLTSLKISRPILIWGPSGVGKNAIVYAIANELGLKVIEINASDGGNVEYLKKTIESASQNKSITFERKVILIDEVDAFSSRSSINELPNLISHPKLPVILTANNMWDHKLYTLRNLCECIELKKLSFYEVKKLILRICGTEGFSISDQIIDTIVKNSDGDLRAAIQDLEIISSIKKSTIEDARSLSRRFREENIFEGLKHLFKAKDAKEALSAFDNIEMDIDQVIRWISENIINEYESAEEIASAYDSISRADIFLGRILRRQHFDLQGYSRMLATAGVFSHRKRLYEKWSRYSPPTRHSHQGHSDMAKDIALAFARKCHTSTKVARSTYLPMFRFIAQNNKSYAEEILSEIGIDSASIRSMGVDVC